MKKTYQLPATTVVKMEICNLLQDSISGIQSNTTLNYRGGGSGPARGREGGSWDDDED